MNTDPKFMCHLSELEPEWLRYDGATDPVTYRRLMTKVSANGICFVCPKCWIANGRQRPGVHSIHCWAPGVPLDVGLVGPGRWELHGTNFEDLTLVAN